MELHNLKQIKEKSKKRLGRGLGSGKGKTGGRGQKGQKARGKVAHGFAGGGLPLYKKLPLLRGWGNVKKSVKPLTINFDQLVKVYKDGEKVSVQTLTEKGLITEKMVSARPVKILGRGELKVKLSFNNLIVSKSARELIEKAGGQVD